MHRGIEPAHFGLQLDRARDQFLQLYRQQASDLASPGSQAGEPDLAFFLAGLSERHFAFLDRAMQQQPGRKLHQPRRQPHAFGGVDQAGAAFEFFGFLAARAVEIARGFLDQRHAVAKQ